jgi:uncharacterized protein (DUF697 family)
MVKAIQQARAAFAMLSPDEIHNRAIRPVSFGLVADSEQAFAEMEDFLIPAGASPAVRAGLRGLVYRAGDPDAPEKVDLVLYQDGAEGPKGTYTFHRDEPGRTAAEIVRANDDIAPAMARAYPAFRVPVVERVIHSIARENALFAIATALPDLIPSLVELPWALGEFASDTAFLTANQIRMAFQIAAACGRPVGFAHQKAEVLGIAAGAFGWRAIARELAGKIPFGGGLIPKGAIAYAVTYGIGKGLERLYHAGAPLTKAERREIYRQAYERGASVTETIAPAR